MPGWELRLIARYTNALDGSRLSQLESIADADEIRRIKLPSCDAVHSRVVGDLFTIKQRADERIVISGDCSFLHRLAYGWTSRALTIEGDVGTGLGTQMRGGRLNVCGNANDGLACQMRGGVIQVKGNVGDFLGGPMSGRRSGMSGGRVVVTGNTGHHTGHRMRRGMVIVNGNCGAALASDMVAGTIVVRGSVGNHVAAGMKRGTLILSSSTRLEPVRFSQPRLERLSAMRLIERDLQDDAPETALAMRNPIFRSLGDLSAGGRGEIWAIGRPS